MTIAVKPSKTDPVGVPRPAKPAHVIADAAEAIAVALRRKAEPARLKLARTWRPRRVPNGLLRW